MKKKHKKKQEIVMPNATLLLALIYFLIGAYPGYTYWSMVRRCTAEIKGIVSAEQHSSSKHHDTSAPQRRYLRGKDYREIEIETDGAFEYDKIWAGAEVGDLGAEVIIRYDPDNPEEYYIVGGYHNNEAIARVTFVISGAMIAASVFLFIYYNKQLLFPKRDDSD
ncbi:DUF3592 domain-containing protein [uncultured Ruminococcus sp.]|uniref:DUF3592 domain-containing protein n=1 Tax=uncultured Ruminococcus sp. TaxID=165186 RepID=UPI0025E3F940|nr:DUF3592 domain-containing protein [uncultured Ruminococcus sp.]